MSNNTRNIRIRQSTRRIPLVFLCLLVFFICTLFAQETATVDSMIVSDEVEQTNSIDELDTDTATATNTNTVEEVTNDSEESSEDEQFENPFLLGEETVDQNEEVGADSATGSEATFLQGSEESEVSEQRGGIDLLVDLAIGANFSQFTIEPSYIQSEGKPTYLFDVGAMVPFANILFAKVGFRYVQLSCDKSVFDTTDTEPPTIFSELQTQEFMAFASVPIKFGLRFELNLFTPYVYVDVEPAYLLAGGQFVTEKTRTVFPEGFELSTQSDATINTTDLRERYQVFLGGGLGLEFSYGYGYVYVDGAVQYVLRETNPIRDLKSKPRQLSSRILFFPISLGLRFYL